MVQGKNMLRLPVLLTVVLLLFAGGGKPHSSSLLIQVNCAQRTDP
jgi:hypothetical protein